MCHLAVIHIDTFDIETFTGDRVTNKRELTTGVDTHFGRRDVSGDAEVGDEEVLNLTVLKHHLNTAVEL